MSEVYAITDIEGYAKEVRHFAACNLSGDYTENLDEFISINQMIGLIEQHCAGHDDNDRPLVDETIHTDIVNDVTTWIQNVGLAKLAANGSLECAWDSNTNTMIFWIPQSQSKDNERKSKPKNKRPKGKDQ